MLTIIKSKLFIAMFFGIAILMSCTNSENKMTQDQGKNSADTTEIKVDSAARVNPEDTIRRY